MVFTSALPNGNWNYMYVQIYTLINTNTKVVAHKKKYRKILTHLKHTYTHIGRQVKGNTYSYLFVLFSETLTNWIKFCFVIVKLRKG